VTEKKPTADEKLPYKGTCGELVIPMDAPERFRWWRAKSRPLTAVEIEAVLKDPKKLNDRDGGVVYLVGGYALEKRWGELTVAGDMGV
jgi:hypothetical protein